MRPTVARPLLVACLAIAAPAWAADPKPEIARPAAAPQAVGAVHTLRQIPEACARLEGAFTGDAAQPYRYAPVRTSPQCQPRALRRFRQDEAFRRGGMEAQRRDPRAERGVSFSAGRRARVAQTRQRDAAAAGWPGPVAHLPAGRQAAGGYRRAGAVADPVRGQAGCGRQGLQMTTATAPHGSRRRDASWPGVTSSRA